MTLSDDYIAHEWQMAMENFHNGSHLGRLIGLRIADDLEAQGVTAADIDRLFPSISAKASLARRLRAGDGAVGLDEDGMCNDHGAFMCKRCAPSVIGDQQT